MVICPGLKYHFAHFPASVQQGNIENIEMLQANQPKLCPHILASSEHTLGC